MAKLGDDSLTDQQELFCQYYVKIPNGSRAYRKAFPDCSIGAAPGSASRLLTNDKILERIETLKEDRLRASKVIRAEVLAELQEMGFGHKDNDDLSARDRISAIEAIIKMEGLAHEPGHGEDDSEISLARATESLARMSNKKRKKAP